MLPFPLQGTPTAEGIRWPAVSWLWLKKTIKDPGWSIFFAWQAASEIEQIGGYYDIIDMLLLHMQYT